MAGLHESDPEDDKSDPGRGDQLPGFVPGASFRVIIPGAPVPCQRARVRRGQGGYYLPRYRQWLDDARTVVTGACLIAYRKRPRWAGPIGVEAEVYGARLNSDPDNLLKAVLDALTGSVLEDDCIRIVREVHLYARDLPKGGEKGVRVTVTAQPDHGR